MLHISDTHASREIGISPLQELSQTAEAIWLVCQAASFGLQPPTTVLASTLKVKT